MSKDIFEAEIRLDELTMRLANEQRKTGALENALQESRAARAEVEAELARCTRRVRLIEKSLSWRLGAPLRKVVNGPDGVKLRAWLRHPQNSVKRKRFRGGHSAELAQRYSVAAASAGAEAPQYKPRELSPLLSASRVGAIGPIRVSAIVPNYNHAGFLKERLHSIRRQTSPVAEIIILDDASTDDSRDVIEGFVRETDIPVVTLFNEENSGSVFNQWAKGLARATGDLVWICESDDSCDRNFLKALAPYFDDPCVMLAFGMIDLIDEEGHPQPGLKDYMDSAAAGFWEEPHVLSARSWFHGPLGIRNVIPNVGGCVFRRQQLSESLVDELRSYRICGDWHLYSVIARGGAIAYEPKARSYFRRHSSNTTRDGFKTEAFFDEHIAIAHAVCRHYGSSDRTIAAMRGHVMDWYRYEFGDEAGKAYAGRHPLSEYLAQKQTIPHAVICLPAEEGGAATRVEVRLANALAKTGCDVSLLVLDGSNGIGQRPPGLCPNIAIFGSSFVNRLGLPDFVEEFAVDVLGTFGDWPEQAGLNTPGTSEIKARGITGSGCKVLFPNVSDDEESLSETALSSGVIRTREQAQDFFVELTRLSGGSAFMLRNTWRLHRERRRQGTRGAA